MKKNNSYSLSLQARYSAREDYVSKQYDQCKQFDQNVFLISSGIFGITFTFIDEIVKQPFDDTKYLLITAWTIIIACMVLSLLAYLISYYAFKEAIRTLDKVISHESYKSKSKRFILVAELFNIVVLVTLAVGLCFLLLFIAKNI